MGSIVQIGIRDALNFGCETFVQVGDFGYFGPRDEGSGSRYLDKISKYMVKAGLKFFWLDGNHDNHPYLWENYPPDNSGFVPMRENVWYMPRGHTWTWDNVRFMSLGGAHSIDSLDRLKEERKRNKPQSLWWPTELITEEEMTFAIGRGSVDVMFTHDCPEGVDIPGLDPGNKWKFPLSVQNRERLASVVQSAKPKLLIHGHYHVRHSNVFDWRERDGWHRVQIEGLNFEALPGFGLAIDTILLSNLGEI